MKRIGYAGLLMLIACVLAGIYGILHNQISYTVSPEYYTEFKFHQFNINTELPDRLGAAIVGFFASWWMGFIISFIVVPVGMVFKDPRQFFVKTLKAFGFGAITALLCGLLALLISFFTITENNVSDYLKIVGTTEEKIAFMRAGTMHNFSYLGGFIGIIAGVIYLLVSRIKLKKKTNVE